jgi:hypothetical protein
MRDSNSSPVNCHLYLTPTGERDYTRWCQWPDSINIATVPVTSCHVPVGPHSSEDHLACMNPLTRLSNHDPLVRSSWRHPPDATNIRQEFQWVWCLRPHRPWQRREVRGLVSAPLVNQRSCARINWTLVHRCVDKSTLAQIFGAYPPELIEVSLPALRSSRPSVQRCKGPHASVILRNRPPPVSLWFQHGLETDLITFFRLHPVEPAVLQSREFAHFLSDPCRAGGIGRDDLIEPQLQRNLTPRTRTTRSINGEVG